MPHPNPFCYKDNFELKALKTQQVRSRLPGSGSGGSSSFTPGVLTTHPTKPFHQRTLPAPTHTPYPLSGHRPLLGARAGRGNEATGESLGPDILKITATGPGHGGAPGSSHALEIRSAGREG